jgi:hypothetical protein
MLPRERRRPMQAQRTWQDLCVSILLAITGLAMVGHWALWLAQRNLVNGIKTVENNQ